MKFLKAVGTQIIITARKRSLGQGNVFTPAYHSVHRGGLCLGRSLSRSVSLSKGPLSRAVPVQDGLCPAGGLCAGGSLSRGSLSREVSVQVGVFVRETPLR